MLRIGMQRQPTSLSPFATANDYSSSCQINIAYLDVTDFLNTEASIDKEC